MNDMNETKFSEGEWVYYSVRKNVLCPTGLVAEPDDGYRACKPDSNEKLHANGYLMAASPNMYKACEATVQCVTDLLEVYKNGASLMVLDLAIKSLRDDALRLSEAAMRKARGEK